MKAWIYLSLRSKSTIDCDPDYLSCYSTTDEQGTQHYPKEIVKVSHIQHTNFNEPQNI